MQYTPAVLGQPTAVVLCVALLLPSPALAVQSAPSPAAREAAALTNAKRYTEAAEAYGRAFEETGEAVHLYSQAMSLRRAGSCPEAIDVFEAFIEQAPPEPDVEAARTQIAECEALIARAAPEPEPEPEPEPPPPQVKPPPGESPPPSRQWTRDPWGGALVAVGGIVAVTGTGLLVASATSGAAVDETERQHARREDEVRRTSIAAFSLLGAGAALLIAGAIRWGTVARRGRVENRGLTWRF